jgi:hypothetical protein
MEGHKFIQNIRELIANGHLPKALQQLQQFLQDSPKLRETILQSGCFADMQQQLRIGVVSDEAADLKKNQIRASILDLLDELEGKGAALLNDDVFLDGL